MSDHRHLHLTADGSESTAPQGICDDCGRIVRERGRAVEVEVPADLPQALQAALAIEAAAEALAARCRTCGMAPPITT